MEYVYLMHVVQERKKFDFVETLWSFMHSWSNYYRFGHERTQVSAPYMNDLKVYMYEYCYIDNIVAKNVYFRETVFSLSQRLRSMFFVYTGMAYTAITIHRFAFYYFPFLEHCGSKGFILMDFCLCQKLF